MSLVIINADDFGYSSGINLGIIQAHEDGILTSTTMMANMPGFDEGVELAKKYPKLGIGVHLTLTCGAPLLDDVPSITENDRFRPLSFYEKSFSINVDELYREWDAQIQKILQSGIEPTHLDSHHHVNCLPQIKDVFIQLARKYHLPVRNNFDVPSDIRTVQKFFIEFDTLGQTKEIWKPMTINNLIQDCKMYKTVEVMCHPGFIDFTLLKNSSLSENRVYVGNELQVPAYKEIFEKNNIKLGTYHNISNLVKTRE